jgi:hypothetical protein
MTIETSKPAFPVPGLHRDAYNNGMTLRDYFAAKAMQADMEDGRHESDFSWCAGRAYRMADAMMKARNA